MSWKESLLDSPFLLEKIMKNDQKHIIITTQGKIVLIKEKEFQCDGIDFCFAENCKRSERKKLEHSM
jgi:hypothetical protein